MFLSSYKTQSFSEIVSPLDFHELDIENERRVPRNFGRRPAAAISKLWWDDQFPFLSLTHTVDSIKVYKNINVILKV